MTKFFKPSRAESIQARVLLLAVSLFSAAAFLASVAVPVSAGQESQSKENAPDLKPFVGTWKGSFQGNVFAILTLKEQKGELVGTMNNFDISVDKEGNLIDGTHKNFGDSPLFNARVKSGALYFLVAEKDAYSQPTEWKFVPKTADEGELIVRLDDQLNAPVGLVIKPIRMLREHAKP